MVSSLKNLKLPNSSSFLANYFNKLKIQRKNVFSILIYFFF